MDKPKENETTEFSKDTLVEAFRQLDRNQDGVLSETEIDQAVIDLAVPPDLAEIVGILKAEFDEIKDLHKDHRNGIEDSLSLADILELANVLVKHPNDARPVTAHEPLRFGRHASRKITDPAERAAKLARNARSIMQRIHAIVDSDLSLYGTHHDEWDVDIEAIQQGQIGNCYFLAALGSVVATNPMIVRRMIKENSDNTYTVTFPGARLEPVTVVRPTIVELALYTRLTEFGIWPAILEKAYGVYNRSMAWTPRLVPAENTDAYERWLDPFNLLTGQDEKYEPLASITPEKLAAILTKAFRERRAVWAASKSTSTRIAECHAYSVINWDPGSCRITLRNPWGPVEGSEPEVPEGGPVDGYLDGIFAVDLDHFFAYFDSIRYEEWATDEADHSFPTGGIQDDTSAAVSDVILLDRFAPAVAARIGGGLVAALVGVALVWIPVDLFIWTYASAQWPVTSGVIEKNGLSVTAPRHVGSFTDLGMLYTYTVGERTYRSHVIGGMVDVLIGADDFEIKNTCYPVGSTVPVHYNPEMPEDSCLRTGFNAYKVLLFVLWILFALAIVLWGASIALDRRFFTDMIKHVQSKSENEQNRHAIE